MVQNNVVIKHLEPIWIMFRTVLVAVVVKKEYIYDM